MKKIILALLATVSIGFSATLPPLVRNVWSTNGNTTNTIQQIVNNPTFSFTNVGLVVATQIVAPVIWGGAIVSTGSVITPTLSTTTLTINSTIPKSFILTNGITGVTTNYTYFTNGLAFTNIVGDAWVAWP